MTSTRLALACLLVLAPLAACGGGHDSSAPQCSDGIDNDGDGLIDFPADPGCTSPNDDSEDSPPSPQCSDGRDNDGDGKIDFPDDPGCSSPNGDSELDDCPNGSNCPQCANGKDDDGNGLIDFPADPGCSSASDPTEAPDDSNACGPASMVLQLPTSNDVTGMVTSTSSSLLGTCGGAGGEAIYQLNLPTPMVVVASTDNSTTTINSVLYIRSAACTMASSEVACAAPVGSATGSTLTVALDKGTYFIVVDGITSISTGTYELTVNLYPGAGGACTGSGSDTTDCGPGLVCNNLICSKPLCNDGIDNDGDGKTDYPNDPGCTSPSDNDETDDCHSPIHPAASGPTCPQCGDGIDNDGDGEIDYPADTSCKSAGGTSEACSSMDAVLLMTTASVMGDTTNATDDFQPTCASDTGAPDLTYQLDLPALTAFTATIVTDPNGNFFAPVLQLLGATCAGTELACDDAADMITVANLAAGTYYLNVDGDDNTQFGAFTLNVSGSILHGERCDGVLATAGALTCESGYVCKGAATKTCVVAACNDGIDNDGDGKTDYPHDPGCTSPSDDDETDDCHSIIHPAASGPTCPACGDGIDNDGDGEIDYPADTSCTSASGTSESCTSVDPLIIAATPTITGDTTGKTNDFEPSCAAETGAPDLTYELDLPGLTQFRASIVPNDGQFPVLDLLTPACGSNELVCDDMNNFITTGALAAGHYFLNVDGDDSFEYGTYTLTLSGTIASGQPCDGALATSGALTCDLGTICKGATTKTCQPAACADGIDNDHDGKTDYPFDPGCSSPSDDDETDTGCPGGAGCPVCSNGMDDDTDGSADYPADYGCSSAGGTSEVFCIGEVDPVSVISAPLTTGTTAMKHNNEVPIAGCVDFTDDTTANDVAFSLQLPVPVAQLQIDTHGSTLETVISFEDANCMGTIACNQQDPNAGFGVSLLLLNNVFAGNYAIVVDGYEGDNNTFKLNVKGTVFTGTACTSTLFAEGVLSCPVGETCTGGVCH